MSIARNGRPGRPSVSVVMPFAGSRDEAWAAVESLARLHVLDGDELLLADNAGALASAGGGRIEVQASTGVSVAIAAATAERSPAHARNTGAAAASAASEWILFLDADTVAPADLLDRYFAEPIADNVGAVAGAITAAPPAPSAGIVARYGAYKNFLDAGSHLAHPFLPRAAAANLLVRRVAFDAVGGFFEGLRAAEDTDFSWRLQRAGWTLAGRPSAAVEHRYRASLRDLRRQWRGYAAGRAWLGRRYDGFAPQPALLRAAAKTVRRGGGRVTNTAAALAERADSGASGRAAAPPERGDSRASDPGAARDRVGFAALDAVLGIEEVIGFALSNRPADAAIGHLAARQVLVADQFPIAQRGAGAGFAPAGPVRIEAGGRAEHAASSSGVAVVYREDDGPLDRAHALITLIARRPVGVLAAAARYRDAPSPVALAPAACRLDADPDATLEPSPDPTVWAATRRLARLAGRESLRSDGWREMLTRRAKASKPAPAPDGQSRESADDAD